MGASKTSYTKGRSGNPSGRPVGAVGKLTVALRKASEKILPLVIEKAESGDFEAQKFLLSLAIPKPKPLPIEPSTEKDRKRILKELREGKMSVEEAALDLSIAGVELPEAVKIMLARVDPLPPDDGVYCTKSNEEMEAQRRERQENARRQREEWLPERRREIQELYKEMEGRDSFAPDARPQERNED